MLFADGTIGVVLLVLWVFCVFDCITSDEARVRSLPKLVWLLIVLLLPDIGSILWLVAGRPSSAARSLPYKGNTGSRAGSGRPSRAMAVHADDDDAFLRGLRARTEQQRRAAEQQRRATDPDTPPLN